jgi:hypothetical protein
MVPAGCDPAKGKDLMSEVMEKIVEIAPDLEVRTNLIRYLATPPGEIILAKIDCDISRNLVHALAASVASAVDELKAKHTTQLHLLREANSLLSEQNALLARAHAPQPSEAPRLIGFPRSATKSAHALSPEANGSSGV